MYELGYIFKQSLAAVWRMDSGGQNRTNETDADADADGGQHLLIHFLCQELVEALDSY